MCIRDSHCSTAFAVRMLATLATAGLLVQCSMPPHEAWRSIQTQGLLPYLSSATRHQSPPFRTGGSYAQRYAAYPRRSHYGSLGSSGFVPNSYFSTLAPAGVSSRYVPRTRLSRPSVERSPDVKIPVEEPRHAHAPNITPNPPPANETPKISACLLYTSHQVAGERPAAVHPAQQSRIAVAKPFVDLTRDAADRRRNRVGRVNHLG